MQQFIYSFQPFEWNKQLSFYFAFLLIFFVKREIWGWYNYNALIHFRYQYPMWVFRGKKRCLCSNENWRWRYKGACIVHQQLDNKKKKQENLHQRFSKHLQVIGKWVILILHVFVFFLVLFIMHHRKYFVKYIFFLYVRLCTKNEKQRVKESSFHPGYLYGEVGRGWVWFTVWPPDLALVLTNHTSLGPDVAQSPSECCHENRTKPCIVGKE